MITEPRQRFVASQQLFQLHAQPDTVRDCLAPSLLPSQFWMHGSSKHRLPNGCHWANVADRCSFLIDSQQTDQDQTTPNRFQKSERLCLVGDSWTGTTTALQQATYLRCCAGQLALYCHLADLPENVEYFLGTEHGVPWFVTLLRNGPDFSRGVRAGNGGPTKLRDLDSARALAFLQAQLRRGRLSLIVDSIDAKAGDIDLGRRVQTLRQFLDRYAEARCVVGGHPLTVRRDRWNDLFRGDGDESSWVFTQVGLFRPSEVIEYAGCDLTTESETRSTVPHYAIPGILSRASKAIFANQPIDNGQLSSIVHDATWRWRRAQQEINQGKHAADPSRHFDFTTLKKVTTGNDVFGRDEWYMTLNEWLESKAMKIGIVHAFGGFGKTALVKTWQRRLEQHAYWSMDQAFGFSFYEQGKDRTDVSAGTFLVDALQAFGDPKPSAGKSEQKVQRLIDRIRGKRTLLIIDGTEVIQYPQYGDSATQFRDFNFETLLFKLLEHDFDGLCLLTTRFPPGKFANVDGVQCRELPRLDLPSASRLLSSFGVRDDILDSQGQPVIDAMIEEFEGHPLALTLAGKYIAKFFKGDPRRREELPPVPAQDSIRQGYEHAHTSRVLRAYAESFEKDDAHEELYLVHLLGLFNRPVEQSRLMKLAAQYTLPGMEPGKSGLASEFERALRVLMDCSLLGVKESTEQDEDPNESYIDTHPLIRSYFRSRFKDDYPNAWLTANSILFDSLLAECPKRLTSIAGPSSESPWVASQQPGAGMEKVVDEERIRSTQLLIANKMVDAIAHGCEAGRNWDALATMMTRLDEQLSPVTEWMLRIGFRFWKRFNHRRWFIESICFVGRVSLNSLFWVKGKMRQPAQVDKPAQFAVARVLQAWELRLSCASLFHPKRSFANPSFLNDYISRSVFELETVLCLTHVGRVEEAKNAAYRAQKQLVQTRIKLLGYVPSLGLALLEMYTGNLKQSLQRVAEAKKDAQTPQQFADAMAVEAFANDLLGNTESAMAIFGEALEIVPRLSHRCMYLYWKSLIRNGGDIGEVSELFESQTTLGTKRDQTGAQHDGETVIRNVRLHLQWRRAIETGELRPRELLQRVETAFDGFDGALHAGFHHRAMMNFHFARALSLCAISNDPCSDDVARAFAELDSTQRHASTANFRIIEVDSLVIRYRLLKALRQEAKASEIHQRIEALVSRMNYAWADVDLKRPWVGVDY